MLPWRKKTRSWTLRHGVRPSAQVAKCGAPLSANAQFCPECDEKVKGGAIYAGCGAKLTPGIKLCRECPAEVATPE